ncbi:FtsK/SpoIIIE domain-containing protein [Streptomyces sp. NPDC006704]|uniref:FtsK/SpoIIIE domain-containing protein n=1 Tax=Streptomyces sp. NPDC006704 TaxID=3364760 RepID=UPI003698C891
MPKKQDEDVWGQSAGAIGALVMVLGGLMVVKEKVGLGWPATVLLVVGVLMGLGYAAWWVKTRVPRWWAHTPGAAEPVALAQESQAEAGEDVVDALEAAHPVLTGALVKAKAIGPDEVILAKDVKTEVLPVGTRFDFALPGARTPDDVAANLKKIASELDVTRLHLKMETSRKTERRVRLLVLDEPPFTHSFPLPTTQDIRTFAGVPLGHEVTGELAGVPGFEKASMMVAGMTQTGKTTLINGLITCLLIAYGPDIDLYLLDGKFSGLVRFEKIAVRYESSNQTSVYESMLNELNEISDDRHRQMEDARRNQRPDPKFRQIIFIIDEAADFYASDGSKESRESVARVTQKSKALVRKSLESSVAVILTTQRPSVRAIPVEVRDQFQYRLCLYVASKGGANVALGDSYFETVAPIAPHLMDMDVLGQAVLYARGRSTLVRGFQFDDSTVWGVVEDVAERRRQRFEATPDTPLKKAIGLMESKGVEFMATVDLAPALGVTVPDMEDAVELGKALSARLGVPSSRGTKGVRGHRLAALKAAAATRS